jgi:hypothetical protein
MGGYDFSDTFSRASSGINGGPDSGDVASDNSRHITAADFFIATRSPLRFHHCISSFHIAANPRVSTSY